MSASAIPDLDPADELSHTEIDDLDSFLSRSRSRREEKYVLRFQIEMEDWVAVRAEVGRTKRVGNLHQDSCDALRVEAPLTSQHLSQFLAIEQLHDEVAPALLVLVKYLPADDVCVLEARQSLCLFKELRELHRVPRNGVVEHLDCDATSDSLVAGFVDGSESALPELSQDPVLSVEQIPELELTGPTSPGSGGPHGDGMFHDGCEIASVEDLRKRRLQSSHDQTHIGEPHLRRCTDPAIIA